MGTKKRADDIGEIIVSTDALAKLFGYTRQRINQLAQEGILEKQAAGRWPLMKNVQRFIDYLKTGRKDQEDDEHQAMFWEEKALHEKAKRQIAEIKLAQLQGRMHDAADVEFVMTNMLVTFRNRILAIPDKLAPKVLGIKNLSEISDIITTELHEALTELSEYDPALFAGGGEDAEDDSSVSEDPESSCPAAEADDQ